MGRAAQQLRAFSQAGGQVLFGTDVGYIEQFDIAEEFVWMSRAALSFQQTLASLTTSPAARFGYSSHSGRIAKGMDADLVILDDDPGKDITASQRSPGGPSRAADLSHPVVPGTGIPSGSQCDLFHNR